MLYQLLASAIIGAVLSGASIWKVQEWRHGALEKDRVEQSLESQRIVAKAQLAAEARVSTAQNLAKVREARLRTDAADSRNALGSLRASTDAALRTANLSHAACLDRAAALGRVFESCSAEYGSLAERAGRHASDLQTLNDAWPGKELEHPADKPDGAKSQEPSGPG